MAEDGTQSGGSTPLHGAVGLSRSPGVQAPPPLGASELVGLPDVVAESLYGPRIAERAAAPADGADASRVEEEIGSVYAAMNKMQRALSSLGRDLRSAASEQPQQPPPQAAPVKQTPYSAFSFSRSAPPADADDLEKAYYAMSSAKEPNSATPSSSGSPASGASLAEAESALAALGNGLHQLVASVTQQGGLVTELSAAFTRHREEIDTARTREASMESIIVTLQKHIERLEEGGGGGGGGGFGGQDDGVSFLEDRACQTSEPTPDLSEQWKFARRQARRKAKLNPRHPVFLRLSCTGCHIPMSRRRWEWLPREAQRRVAELQYDVDQYIIEQQRAVSELVLPPTCVFCEEKPEIEAIDEFGAPEALLPKKSKAEQEKELAMRILLKEDGEFLVSEIAGVAAALSVVSVAFLDVFSTMQDLPDDVAALVVINKWRALGNALDVVVEKNPKQRLGLRLDNDLKVLGVDARSPAADAAIPPIPVDWYLLALNHLMVDKLDSGVRNTLTASAQVSLTFAKRRVSANPQEDLKDILYREVNIAGIIEQHQNAARVDAAADSLDASPPPAPESTASSEEECEGPLSLLPSATPDDSPKAVSEGASEGEGCDGAAAVPPPSPTPGVGCAGPGLPQRGGGALPPAAPPGPGEGDRAATPEVPEGSSSVEGLGAGVVSGMAVHQFPLRRAGVAEGGGRERGGSGASSSLSRGAGPATPLRESRERAGSSAGASEVQLTLRGSPSAAEDDLRSELSTTVGVMAGSAVTADEGGGWFSRMMRKKPKKKDPPPEAASDAFPTYDEM